MFIVAGVPIRDIDDMVICAYVLHDAQCVLCLGLWVNYKLKLCRAHDSSQCSCRLRGNRRYGG